MSKYFSEILNKKIISNAHSGILGGHYSVEKTLQRIRQKYNWQNITVDVKEFISKCESCQFNKQVPKNLIYIPLRISLELLTKRYP